MNRQMLVTDKSGTSFEIFYRGTPDTCPLCHSSIYPGNIMAILYQSGLNTNELQIISQCVRNGCESAFIGIYPYHDGQNPQEKYYKITYILPKIAKKEIFSDEINKVSPILSFS